MLISTHSFNMYEVNLALANISRLATTSPRVFACSPAQTPIVPLKLSQIRQISPIHEFQHAEI